MRSYIPLFAALFLAGCQEAAPPDRETPRGVAHDEGRIDCAPGGAVEFAPVCTVEEAREASGVILLVREPDGGFRRLQVTGDGRGVIAADGAEPARVTLLGADRIEVAIGDDRYRLPARVKTPD